MEKENEIRRLHSVCQAKDRLIVLLIDHLEYVLFAIKEPEKDGFSGEYLKQIEDLVAKEKNNLG